MKLYIATPINARQEPTMREKLVAAKHRVEMLKEILADGSHIFVKDMSKQPLKHSNHE